MWLWEAEPTRYPWPPVKEDEGSLLRACTPCCVEDDDDVGGVGGGSDDDDDDSFMNPINNDAVSVSSSRNFFYCSEFKNPEIEFFLWYSIPVMPPLDVLAYNLHVLPMRTDNLPWQYET